MRCFAVSVSAVHSDSNVSVVSFDIAGTLMQKSEQQCRHWPLHHLKGDLTSRENVEVLAAAGVCR